MVKRHSNLQTINRLYPGALRRTTGGKWFWENADTPPARFVFDTASEAANDLAVDLSIKDHERVW